MNLLLLLAFLAPQGALSPIQRVAIQPLGSVPAQRVVELQEDLSSFLAVPIAILPSQALPAAAFYLPRRRYRGTALLEWLELRTPSPRERVVGVTTSDISVAKPPYLDWGVFGVSYLNRPAAMVSTYRLKVTGATPGISLRIRLYRVTLHELGHTLGLDHCPDDSCLMADAKGKRASVDQSGSFCAQCLRIVSARVPVVPPNPALQRTRFARR